jgi:hypothetical protein
VSRRFQYSSDVPDLVRQISPNHCKFGVVRVARANGNRRASALISLSVEDAVFVEECPTCAVPGQRR